MYSERRKKLSVAWVLLAFGASLLASRAENIWMVGMNDNGWPVGDGGGPNASFVQEGGGITPLPGDPLSPEADQQADNDYYFAGEYTTVLPGITAIYGDYEPVGTVEANEEAAERAFAGADNDLRYHFNLPATLQPSDLLSITFDALSLDDPSAVNTDRRYGIEIWVNGVMVQPEILIRPTQLNVPYTTPQFKLSDVDARVGPGFDNIVSLKGISYSNDGGGAWMGIDYVQLDHDEEVIPLPVFPWAVGKKDGGFPVGDGGGPNTSFVQENSTINPLPGSPTSPEIDQQADNDYYFAGLYTTVIAGNGAYEPVGLVPVNEEAAERAFAGGDLELRYHFNLPNTMKPSDLLEVTYSPISLDDPSEVNTDPRFGVEVYVNNVLVQPQLLVRAAQLNKDYTSAQFSLASVNAQVGSGFDNIVTLKGISYNNEGGGNWMGIDYVQLNPVTVAIPNPVLPWTVGLKDDGWPVGDGGGPNATFVQENGVVNPLPGSPISPETDQQADNDYYLAGLYTSVIPSNGNYEPVGAVPVNEEAAERAFAGENLELRYHSNLPAVLKPDDMLSVSFAALNLDDPGPVNTDPRFGVEVYINNVLVQPQILIRPAQLRQIYTTPEFTLASVNAQPGQGVDNIVTLKGISYNNDGGGNWMGIDYVGLNVIPKSSFPWAVGKDDNGWPAGNGGGPNTTFVQEAGGINPLPGSPNNAEVDQQGDNDYYFAGIYTQTLEGVVAIYGEYEPVGVVLANEESAERAFAGADLDLRYHFNLPATLQPTDQLSVTFDALNLDDPTEINTDRRFGIEVWVNGVMIQPEILIRPEQLNTYIATPAFTLDQVGAKVGSGFDNIVSLKGISYNNDGGGNWMGIDYVQLNQVFPSTFPWTVGMNDNAHPAGNGGGANATFVQENGVINALPGSPVSPEIDQQADNDYYLAGTYTTVIEGNGDYLPVGLVAANEEAAERAFAGGDLELRYHFNLPETMKPTDELAVSFDAVSLDDPSEVNTDPRFGVEVYVNSILVQPEILIHPAELGVLYTTPLFTLASVNAKAGPGFDNIVTLKGVSYNDDGGGNWMGIDFVALNPPAPPEAPKFLPPVLSGGQITLNWTGGGKLEWAPTVLGPWTAVVPQPNPPFSEAVSTTQNRFYRLR